jgi:protein MpaA
VEPVRRWGPLLIGLVVVGACASPGSRQSIDTVATTAGAEPSATPPPTTATTAATTTIPPASTVAPAVTDPPTSADRAPVPPGTVATVGLTYDIGHSVEGRPITVYERGTPGGKVVLVVGVIHGDEQAGVKVVRDLAAMPLPAGIHLHLVESMNPDGQARDTRTNARLVDLNRNFPFRWAPLGQPGDWQYAGTGPASEPEVKAMVKLISDIRPELAVWYHQDLNRLSPATGHKGEMVRRYSELTGLPILPVTGGTYTGTATPWEEDVVNGSAAFIVELGPTLSDEQAATHAGAVLDIAA